MKRLIILSLLSCLFAPARLLASAGHGCDSMLRAGYNIRVADVGVRRGGGMLSLDMRLVLDSLRMPSNRQLVFRPVVRAEGRRLAMPEVVINGRRQHIMYERGVGAARFGGEAKVVRRVGAGPQSVDYTARVALPEGVHNYDIDIEEDLCGCGDSIGGRRYPLLRRRKPMVAYMRPEADTIKVRHIDKKAYIDFPVNKITLYPEYRRNPAELDSIIRTISLLKSDADLTVTSVNIHGYASPESPYAHNDYLARNRASTLKDYVCRMVKLDDEVFSVSHTAEDWEGLRKYIGDSNLEHKDAIMEIAADESLDPDARERKIKQEYPEEYRFMLATWYPALRHSDYHITYRVRPFSVEEAKLKIKTNPRQLSQQEMYLVAQEYEPGSDDFKDIMETAVRMFPADTTANLNAACTRIDAGDADGAKPYLDKAGDSAQAINARGAYMLLKGNEAEAAKLFEKASGMGLEEARKNLENLSGGVLKK